MGGGAWGVLHDQHHFATTVLKWEGSEYTYRSSLFRTKRCSSEQRGRVLMMFIHARKDYICPMCGAGGGGGGGGGAF